MSTSPKAATGLANGRLEVLGNHTDYNLGLVLAMGVDFQVRVRAERRSDSQLVFYTQGLSEDWTGSIHDLSPRPDSHWVNYLLGVLQALRDRSVDFPGLKMTITSNLPMGGGLSSSAALTVATQRSMQNLIGYSMSKTEMAKISQEVEHRYAGVRCGLLDPMAILHARKNSLVRIDFRSLSVTLFPFSGKAVFVVAASGEPHALTTGEYNERRHSCEEAARSLGLASLRAISRQGLEKQKNRLPEKIYRRALHVVGETDRVERGEILLGENNLPGLGQLLDESQESSRINFENSTPTLDRLCEISRNCPGHLGARLSGGGFGGSTLHLVEADRKMDFLNVFEKESRAVLGRTIQTFITGPAGV